MADSALPLCEALCRLVQAGQQLQHATEAPALASGEALLQQDLRDIAELALGCSKSQTGSASIWALLAAEGCSLRDISRALESMLQRGAPEAAQALCHLLTIPDCPVAVLLNRGVLAAFLHHLRKSCAQLAPVKPSQAKDSVEDMDLDMPDASELTQASQVPSSSASPWTDCAFGLSTLARVMGDLNLEEQDGTLQDVIEACTGLLKAPGVPGAAADASFAVLLAILEPSHGSVPQLAAQVFKPLTAVLLGFGGKAHGGGGPKSGCSVQKLREHALGFLAAAVSGGDAPSEGDV